MFVNQEKTNHLYVYKYTYTYSSPNDPKNDSYCIYGHMSSSSV